MNKSRGFFRLSSGILACTLGLFGCFSPPKQLSSALTDRAGPGESEIVIERESGWVSSAAAIAIYIDGELKREIPNGGRVRIVVPNGRHILHAGSGSGITEELTLDVDSQLITFKAGFDWGRVFLAKKSVAALDNPAIKTGIEGALERAAQELMGGNLPRDAQIAIMNVSSEDGEQAKFVAERLEYLLVKGGYMIVDRSDLDQIRQEQNFQFSGSVDEGDIISIGKFAGAGVVITGAISSSGSAKWLRFRALDTETAKVLSVASEQF